MTSYLFTMADMESHADFARRRGSKDKSKRKSRGAGFYGAVGGGTLAGAGAIGAGVRYGGAEIKARKAAKNYSTPALKNAILGQGAKGRLGRDIDSIKAMGSRVKNYDYAGAPGKAWSSAKRAGSALATGSGKGYLDTAGKMQATNRGLLREPIGRLGNVWKSGAVGKAGMLGAGALGAAGAGYAGYRALKNRKKKR